MEDLDLECAKTDINCGTDLMFYIEMDPPGNTAVLMEKLVNFLTLIFFFFFFGKLLLTDPLEVAIFTNLFHGLKLV